MERETASDGACEVWDVGSDADTAVFECLRCGWFDETDTHPGTCPECGNDLRNCAMPIE